MTSEAQLKNITSFFKNKAATLVHLFSCNSSYCDPEGYRRTVYNYTNVLALGLTPSGKIMGGFRSKNFTIQNDTVWQNL